MDDYAYLRARYQLNRDVSLPGMPPFSVGDDNFFEKIREHYQTTKHKPYLASTASRRPGIWHKIKSRGAMRFSWETLKPPSEKKDKRRVYVLLEPGENCEVGIYMPNACTLQDIFKSVFLAPALPEHIELIAGYATYLNDHTALAPCTVQFLQLVNENNTEKIPLWKAFGDEPPTFEDAMTRQWLRESARVRKQPIARKLKNANKFGVPKTIEKKKRSNGIVIGPVTMATLSEVMHAPIDDVDPFDDEFSDIAQDGDTEVDTQPGAIDDFSL